MIVVEMFTADVGADSLVALSKKGAIRVGPAGLTLELFAENGHLGPFDKTFFFADQPLTSNGHGLEDFS